MKMPLVHLLVQNMSGTFQSNALKVYTRFSKYIPSCSVGIEMSVANDIFCNHWNVDQTINFY